MSMDELQREECDLLRGMDSSEAVEWLLNNYPDNGCFYISKRTWKKADQVRLADHFLKTVPHASSVCYVALITAMGVSKFISYGNATGLFTLLMENTSDGWKILHDHTSADNG